MGREKFKFKIGPLTAKFGNRCNRGLKAAEAARNICAVYGEMPSERARHENDFLVLRRIVLTLVTFHVQEDPRDLMKIV